MFLTRILFGILLCVFNVKALSMSSDDTSISVDIEEQHEAIFDANYIAEIPQISNGFRIADLDLLTIMSEINAEDRLTTLDAIGYFGLGLYGAGVFERYVQVYRTIQTATLKINDASGQLWQTFEGIDSHMNDILQSTKEKLNERVKLLKELVETMRTMHVNAGRNASCFEEIPERMAEIRSVVALLDVDTASFEINNKIRDSLDTILTSYGQILISCRRQHPSLFTQIRSIERCVANRLVELESERQSVFDFISKEYFSGFTKKISDLVNTTTDRFNSLYGEIYNFFYSRLQTCDRACRFC